MSDTAPATCTATIKWGSRSDETPTRCTQPAGHYDGDRKPDSYATPYDPGGWHQGPTPALASWADWADGATPHTPAVEEPASDAEAALALLHEGEEPYEHEHTVATPAQWIWLWNRATPERRLEVAGDVMEACGQSDRCLMGGHEERLERAGAAEAAVERVRTVLDRWIRYTQLPQTMRALSEVRAALTGEEQPATGGIIGTSRFRQVGEGPVCDGPLLPPRARIVSEHGPELVHLPRRQPGAARAAIEAEYPDETEPTADPNAGLVVGEYRHDQGHKAWVFRCWGDEPSGCDGWLSLDHMNEAAAIRARDRHVAEKHTAPAACDCGGSSAGLNACAVCPAPWPVIPGATQIRRNAAVPTED